MNISAFNTSLYSEKMYVSGTVMNYTFLNTSFTSRNITTSIRNLYLSATNTSIFTNYLDLQGITVNTNAMNANINSTLLNLSTSNLSIQSYNASINTSILTITTNVFGIGFSSNPRILNSNLETQDGSNLVPTTNWVKNYVTSQSGSLVGSGGGGSNSSTVAYGVNLLELKRFAPDYTGSSSDIVLPEGTTRISILMMGAGGAAGSNVNTTNSTTVNVGIGGAGGSGAAIYYPSIQCNFSIPFTINFSNQLNGVVGAKGTVLSYSTTMLNALNASLAQPIIAIANGGGDGTSTTAGLAGGQGTPGTGVIYYTYGQSVCQPGSLNISGDGQYFAGPKSTSKTFINYGGQNILSYETNSTYLENVGGSQQIIYNGTNYTFTTNTKVAGTGAVYVWCWNDSSMLLVNTPNTFNVSNGLGTQYNQMNSLSQVISYKDFYTGPSKVLTISNVSKNASISYIDNIENKHLDLYTIGGFKFNASLTNMDIYSNNPVSALKVSVGSSVTTINGVENTIQLGNANVITRTANLDSLTPTSTLTIGSTQTTGAISFANNPRILNSTLSTQDASNLVPTTNWVKNYVTSQSGSLGGSGNSSTVNASTVNTSNLFINGSTVVFNVLRDLGLSVNSNNVLSLDTSGNTTVGNQKNTTIVNASCCMINSSSMFINSNGYNNLFSDNSGNMTLGDPYGVTNIMGNINLLGSTNLLGTLTLQQPIAPSYSYPVAAGRIGEVIKSTTIVCENPIVSTNLVLCKIIVPTIGVYVLTFSSQFSTDNVTINDQFAHVNIKTDSTDNILNQFQNYGYTVIYLRNPNTNYYGYSFSAIINPTTNNTTQSYYIKYISVPSPTTLLQNVELTAVRIA